MCFFHNFFNLFETVNTISCKCVIKEAIVNTISCKRVIVNVSLRRLLQILTVNSEKSVDIYNDI